MKKKLLMLITASVLSTGAFCADNALSGSMASAPIDFKIKQIMVSFPSECDLAKNISASSDVPPGTDLDFGGGMEGSQFGPLPLPQTSQELIQSFKDMLPKLPFERQHDDMEFFFGAECHLRGPDFETHLSCIDKSGQKRRIYFHIYDGKGNELSRDTQLTQNPSDGIITLVGNFNVN